MLQICWVENTNITLPAYLAVTLRFLSGNTTKKKLIKKA